MKNTIVVFSILFCLILCGCVVNRPVVYERTYDINGLTSERELRINSFALWPATQSLDKQRVSLGKTFSVGQSGMEQEGGGTNIIEALRAIDSILGKVR